MQDIKQELEGIFGSFVTNGFLPWKSIQAKNGKEEIVVCSEYGVWFHLEPIEKDLIRLVNMLPIIIQHVANPSQNP